jgi:ABC-type thiamin/hydroxymethylpyrimidine transport system permease subunit
VISLMIGSAVDRANCGNGVSSTATNVTSTTLSPMDSTLFPNASSDNTTGLLPDHSVMSEEMICRVGVATAVTFIAGLIQVNHLNSFSTRLYLLKELFVKSHICVCFVCNGSSQN